MPKPKKDKSQLISASFRKQTISGKDNSEYYIFNPSIGIDTNTTPSFDDLIKTYMTVPLVFKAINIRANKVISKGFKLTISQKIEEEEEFAAEEVLKKCDKFLNKIGINFFRQSVINAYVGGNEWTEIVYNRLGHVISLNHGDFKTIDFRRNFINNKILLDDKGEPVAFWQYIENLAELYYNISSYYNIKESWENLEAVRKRFELIQKNEFTEPYVIRDLDGRELGAISRKPMYLYLKNNEIAHLSFNNINDIHYGLSLIVPAYNSITQLERVMNATTEMINTLGYPKPVISVGSVEKPPTPKLIDDAGELVRDPVMKESFAIPYYYDIKYLESKMGSGDISTYPEWYITNVAIGLRVPRELLTGEGEANRSNAQQGSSDFEKDCEADRRAFEKYIYKILDLFLQSYGYEEDSRLIPEVEWEALISEDEALVERMVLDKWNAGLINFNEAREMLELPAIPENEERAVKYNDEIQQGGMGDMFGGMDLGGGNEYQPEPTEELIDDAEMSDNFPAEARESEFEAQFRLDSKKKINTELNKEFKTQNIDYKQLAQKETGKLIKTTSKANAKKIRDVIVNGVADGKSNTELLNKITELGNYDKPYYAKRILRTELKNLSSKGAYDNAKKKGLKYKMWEAVIDNKTGPDSKALNGQIVGIDENFKATWKDDKGKIHKWEGKFPPERPNTRCKIRYFDADADSLNKLNSQILKKNNIDTSKLKTIEKEVKTYIKDNLTEKQTLDKVLEKHKKLLMASPFMIGLITGLIASMYKKK